MFEHEPLAVADQPIPGREQGVSRNLRCHAATSAAECRTRLGTHLHPDPHMQQQQEQQSITAAKYPAASPSTVALKSRSSWVNASNIEILLCCLSRQRSGIFVTCVWPGCVESAPNSILPAARLLH
jgi:hypothetical protein